MSTSENTAAAALDPPLAFLQPLIGRGRPYSHRPWVTLTYAQSLDGKLAGPKGKQIHLSGRESKAMTHRLRTMHGAIMVGIETLLNDDPLLNARDLPALPEGREHNQPTPIILDARARFPLSSRLFRNFKEGKGKRPWIVCDSLMCRADRRIELEDAGCRILVMPTKGTGIFDLLPLLDRINTSITHLMIEGGSRVISSFLTSPKNVLDVVIVTVAPTFVGEDGVGVLAVKPGENLPEMVPLATRQFGNDAVFACKPRHADRFS